MSASGLPPVSGEHLYDYGGICWWCGESADSREHKWKRSEVADLFGRGSYDSVVWLRTGRGDEPAEIEPVRGPKAARLMFGYSLCGQCNGTRSQPFDRAYARFSSYVINHHAQLLDQGWFDIADIFGKETENEVANLSRYYGKHIGCRIADMAGRVPENLISFLDGELDSAICVYSEFGIRKELLNVERNQVLSLRESVADGYTDRVGLASFKSGIGVGAIEFLYDVNLDPDRAHSGNGIIDNTKQRLWPHGEDLYGYKFHSGQKFRRPFHFRP